MAIPMDQDGRDLVALKDTTSVEITTRQGGRKYIEQKTGFNFNCFHLISLFQIIK